MAGSATRLPEEDRSDIRPDIPGIRDQENGVNPEDTHTAGHLDNTDGGGEASKFNPDGDKASGDKKAADGLSSAEDSAASGGSLFNEDGDEPTGLFKRAKKRRQAFKSKLKSFTGNKWLVGGAIGGGGGTVILLILLVMIAGSLKIPNLAEHITSYEFARVVRQYGETNRRLNYQKMAIDSADDSTYKRIKADYDRRTNDFWGKFDKYRPQKVIENLQTNDKFKYTYDTPRLGRERLKSVTLGEKEFKLKPQGYTRYIPGVSGAVEGLNKIQFAKEFAPALDASLRNTELGTIVRGQTAKQIRKRLGINLVAWQVGKYLGKSPADAELLVNEDVHRKVANTKPDGSVVSSVNDATEKLSEEEAADVKDKVKLREAINNGGIFKGTYEAAQSKLTGGTAEKIVSATNSTYATAMAACIIYDGSLEKSGPTINAQTESQQKAYYFLAAAADQQKYGDTNGEAVGATNAKLDDITQSNAEIRASGGTPDTSTSVSSEASAGGDFSIFSAVLGDGAIASAFEGVSDVVCPPLTNIYVGSIGAVALAALTALSGGAVGGVAKAADGAVDVATKSLAKRFVEKIAANFGKGEAGKEVRKNTAVKIRSAVDGTLKSAGKVAGLTVLAKLIVLQKSHSLNNGLEQGNDFANMADAGANISSNDIMREQFYGRPLRPAEISDNHLNDLAFISDQERAKPAFDRYLAMSNPNSLLNRSATMVASTVHHTVLSSFLTLGTKLFTPISSLNHVFGSFLMPRSAMAATYNSATMDYGNVQWGYSDDELSLIHNDGSYGPLENNIALEASGKEADIEAKYKVCFDPGKKIGDLLAEQLIKRDSNGNVLDDDDLGDNTAVCSPNDLGVDNDIYGTNMVFRWRLKQMYEKGLDNLLDQQEIKKDDATPTTSMASEETGGGGQTTAESGDEVAVAKEILANSNISFIFSAKEDVVLESQGKVGTNGVHNDIRGLQIVAALGKKHKIVVSAFESHGQGHSSGSDHYTGHAVDIANIDGKFGFIDITDDFPEIADYAKNATFLQGNCPGAKAAPAGMNRKNGDACNHQHISLN